VATSKPVYVAKLCAANLEFLPSIGIKGPVVVENVDEGKVVTNPNFVIVSIMGGGNLYGSGAEFHIDDD
jgi:hypothetical protein